MVIMISQWLQHQAHAIENPGLGIDLKKWFWNFIIKRYQDTNRKIKGYFNVFIFFYFPKVSLRETYNSKIHILYLNKEQSSHHHYSLINFSSYCYKPQFPFSSVFFRRVAQPNCRLKEKTHNTTEESKSVLYICMKNVAAYFLFVKLRPL